MANKKKRLRWAETLEDWKKVLWTDEIKFEILGPNRTFLRCRKKKMQE